MMVKRTPFKVYFVLVKVLAPCLALITFLLLAACSSAPAAAPLSPAAASATPAVVPVTPSPQAAALPSPTPTPTLAPAPTLTPTPAISVYNRYLGKDEKRQPDLIKTPLGSIIAVSSAAGYAKSALAAAWEGKQVNGDPIRGDPIMLEHLIQLFNDASQAGHRSATVLSSYRSYEEQVYLKQQDTAENEKYLAAPGRSEHQLGTAVDLAWQTERLNFNVMNVYPPARAFYNYLKENAQRYGFIFSYPFKSNANQSKTNILEPYVTEYKAEPWHLRYVGIELAEKIFAARDEQGRNYLDPLSPLLPQQFLLP